MKTQAAWDKHAIKAEIHRRGMTLSRLTETYGIEKSATRVALIRTNSQGERVIAAFLGIDPSVLWPDRYDSPSVIRNSSNARRRPRASQKRTCRADLGAAE